jgi:hypothetical protein
VVAKKEEWHCGELFPMVSFAVPNLSAKAKVEQWIKEGEYALNWTRLSC